MIWPPPVCPHCGALLSYQSVREGAYFNKIWLCPNCSYASREQPIARRGSR